MKCKFSEFQFAHFVTREIEDRIIFSGFGLGMPNIPNQIVEASGGYDVSFNGSMVSIYLQYKLSEKLTRSSANEWKRMGSKEYYRFEIYPDNLSSQHNNLCRLANKSKKNKVFYCAPAFTEMDEMESYYNKREVSNNSAFIQCDGLSMIKGDEKHNICYNINPLFSRMHSEPIDTVIYKGWEWVLNEPKETQYSNMKELIFEISEMNDIQITKESKWFDLVKISEHFAKKGIHMLVLNTD